MVREERVERDDQGAVFMGRRRRHEGGGEAARMLRTLYIAQSQLKEAVDEDKNTHTQLSHPIQVLQWLQGWSLLSHSQDAPLHRTHIRCFDVLVVTSVVISVSVVLVVFSEVHVFACGCLISTAGMLCS